MATLTLVAVAVLCVLAPWKGSLEVAAGSHTRLCADPLLTGTDMALASTYVTNRGWGPVTITKVEPVDASGIEVGAAYLIPQDAGGGGYTIGGPIPPDPADPYSVGVWDRRVDAEGAVIEPDETWQVIQRIRLESLDDAYFSALRIEYTEHGVHHASQNMTEMGVEGHSPACS